MNNSLHWPIHVNAKTGLISWRECSKKHALSPSEGFAVSPAQTQGRQDALYHGQGRSPFDARSIHCVRERERREERQVCEPEGQAKGRERRWRPLRPSSGQAFFNIPKGDSARKAGHSWIIRLSGEELSSTKRRD
ncbi:MAG: hypothetical protein VST68_08220 [Nitrospirota bacterium]|nr:hypothetical protein [Nitrospirota bacterium]